MSKITSCSAWNKDVNAANCRNAKSSQLVCFPIITAELITAAVLKHSNSVSNNISKDVVEEWINVTQSAVFREERCPCWKNIHTSALSPRIQRSQTSVHVLWVKYNVIISYRILLPHILQRRFPSKHLHAKTPQHWISVSCSMLAAACTSITQHEPNPSTDNSKVSASNKGLFVCDWGSPLWPPNAQNALMLDKALV